jgi:hypothetical protein
MEKINLIITKIDLHNHLENKQRLTTDRSKHLKLNLLCEDNGNIISIMVIIINTSWNDSSI